MRMGIVIAYVFAFIIILLSVMCYRVEKKTNDYMERIKTDYLSHLPKPPKEYPPKHLIYHKIPDKIYLYPTFEEGERISFYWAEEGKEDTFWYNGDEGQVFGPIKLRRLNKEDISACDIID